MHKRKQTNTHTSKQANKQTDTCTDTQTNTHAATYLSKQTVTHLSTQQTHKQAPKQIHSHTCNPANKHWFSVSLCIVFNNRLQCYRWKQKFCWCSNNQTCKQTDKGNKSSQDFKVEAHFCLFFIIACKLQNEGRSRTRHVNASIGSMSFFFAWTESAIAKILNAGSY